jgi:hypothetical protein
VVFTGNAIVEDVVLLLCVWTVVYSVNGGAGDGDGGLVQRLCYSVYILSMKAGITWWCDWLVDVWWMMMCL